MTLYEAVAGWLHDQARKHDLGEDYAERYINDLSQHEFLERLSEALENAGVMTNSHSARAEEKSNGD